MISRLEDDGGHAKMLAEGLKDLNVVNGVETIKDRSFKDTIMIC